MRKEKELTDPNSCMSKAFMHEMTFVLLARDAAAPSTIRHWIQERIRLGKNKADDPQIQEAFACIQEMEIQRAQFAQRKGPQAVFALVNRLLTHGGCVVRACDITAAERKLAEENNAVYADGEGHVLVWKDANGVSLSGQNSGIGWGKSPISGRT